jgi:hypothetical protein
VRIAAAGAVLLLAVAYLVERQLADAADARKEYLLAYSADTALNRYVVDQYILGQAIIARR